MNGLFPNAWHVARREYRQRVATRTFVIVTAVLAVAGLGIGLLPIIGRLIEGDPTTTLAVYSADGELRSSSVTAIGLVLSAQVDSEEEPNRVVSATDPEVARQEVRDGELDGLLTVERGEDGDLDFELVTDVSFTDPWLSAVRQAATQVTIGDRLQRAGVDPSQAGEIFAPTAFDVSASDTDAAGGPDQVFGADYILANILVILTFMAIVTYGSWVAVSVAEEKSSRVMELLITAASPRQLLTGKVLGNGGAGLTQYAVVIAAVLAAVLLQGFLAERILGAGGATSLEQVDLVVLIPFGLLFVPGFMLYCILYAGLGSLASRQEDVTQVTGPMLFVGMAGYFVAFVAMATPDESWIKLLSLIPFFSPYLLPTRYLLGTSPALWEWAVAGVLMLAVLLVALWIAARIYSAGVLLYGQRPTFRSAWKAVRVNR